jgi:hypothetical protein
MTKATKYLLLGILCMAVYTVGYIGQWRTGDPIWFCFYAALVPAGYCSFKAGYHRHMP